MDYSTWIDRERRARAKILKTSLGSADASYRICLDCDEVCLCHEDECPNCGSKRVSFEKVDQGSLEGRIRCWKRFEMLKEAGSD